MNFARALLLTACCLTAGVVAVTLTDHPAQACCPLPPTIEYNLDEYLTQVDHQVNENYDNAQVVYHAGRAHMLAAVCRTEKITVRTYNEAETYQTIPTPGIFLSESQAAFHARRALELFARAEMLDPDMLEIPVARGYLLDCCAQQSLSIDSELTPLPTDETARWNTVIATLNHPRADVRARAYRCLAEEGAAILPVLLTAADHADLGVRTQVRMLILACHREQAFAEFNRAFDRYEAAAQKADDKLAYAAERTLCGNACKRLIEQGAATGDTRSLLARVARLEKNLKRAQPKYVPQVESCEG